MPEFVTFTDYESVAVVVARLNGEDLTDGR